MALFGVSYRNTTCAAKTLSLLVRLSLALLYPVSHFFYNHTAIIMQNGNRRTELQLLSDARFAVRSGKSGLLPYSRGEMRNCDISEPIIRTDTTP